MLFECLHYAFLQRRLPVLSHVLVLLLTRILAFMKSMNYFSQGCKRCQTIKTTGLAMLTISGTAIENWNACSRILWAALHMSGTIELFLEYYHVLLLLNLYGRYGHIVSMMIWLRNACARQYVFQIEYKRYLISASHKCCGGTGVCYLANQSPKIVVFIYPKHETRSRTFQKLNIMMLMGQMMLAMTF